MQPQGTNQSEIRLIAEESPQNAFFIKDNIFGSFILERQGMNIKMSSLKRRARTWNGKQGETQKRRPKRAVQRKKQQKQMQMFGTIQNASLIMSSPIHSMFKLAIL